MMILRIALASEEPTKGEASSWQLARRFRS